MRKERRYRTELSQSEDGNHFGSSIIRQATEVSEIQHAPQERLKKLVMKKSMRQFKIDKRLKQRKQHPSFILDSMSINDRLTTQPEVMPTQNSNREEEPQKRLVRAQSVDIEQSTKDKKVQIKARVH